MDASHIFESATFDVVRSAPERFSYCIELVDLTISECTWTGLMVFSKVCRLYRQMVFVLIRSRVKCMMSKFLPSDSIGRFFEILDSSQSIVAGGVVRCIMSVDQFDIYELIHPIQLNIVVPFVQNFDSADNGTDAFRRWKQFLVGCGYRNECGGGDGIAPFHLTATATTWTVLKSDYFQNLRISLLQSKTVSALSPVLQSCHTSNFFVMSSTRMYSFYPKLFAAKVSVNMKDRMPVLKCAFDSFNFGLMLFTTTEDWDVFPGGYCDEACPAKWRHVRDLPSVGVFWWGGYRGDNDAGAVVSKNDVFEKRNEIWKVHGECCNQACPSLFSYSNLIQCVT